MGVKILKRPVKGKSVKNNSFKRDKQKKSILKQIAKTSKQCFKVPLEQERSF